MKKQEGKNIYPAMISRQRVGDYFPGLSPKTLANEASCGRGPKQYKRGRTVFYKFEDLMKLFKAD